MGTGMMPISVPKAVPKPKPKLKLTRVEGATIKVLKKAKTDEPDEATARTLGKLAQARIDKKDFAKDQARTAATETEARHAKAALRQASSQILLSVKAFFVYIFIFRHFCL